MPRDETDRPDPEQSPGVGTDGSLTSHHHRAPDGSDEHIGVGTDGSLHHDQPDEPGHAGVGTDGSLHHDRHEEDNPGD